jgi:hypothetical protein
VLRLQKNKEESPYQAGDGEAVMVDGMTLDLDDVLQRPLAVELARLVALHPQSKKKFNFAQIINK